ncbi:MAG: hypothetical protein ACE5K4_05340 [Candidatus Hydrothermarchaeota archaeon]
MYAEQIFKDLTRLPFKLNTPEDWKQWLEKAGLIDVQIYENKGHTRVKGIIRAYDGFGKIFKLIKEFQFDH